MHIYRRHKANCKHRAQRTSRECRCPLWAKGQLEGKPYQRSLKTRSITRAEQLLRQLQDGNQPQAPKDISIKDALDAFIADSEDRHLAQRTRAKYRLLRDKLAGFCECESIRNLSGLGPDYISRFRRNRNLGALASAKELERIRSFFKFCVDREWLTKNPAKTIKPPKVKPHPRLPFSEQEVQNILSAAKDSRELAFILTLRHTGLRIGDASLLRADQLSNGRIYLYTTKAGTPVSVVVPPTLASLLKALPTTGGYFFLWGESTHVHSVSNLWRRRIKAICKDVGITPDHPHRFRHSLAADLLSKGASVEDVAAILGNSPAIVVKHYSQWIKSRQDRLDEIVSSTWTTGLKRVK